MWIGGILADGLTLLGEIINKSLVYKAPIITVVVILNDISKGQTRPSEGYQMEETSNNAISHDEMPAESINHHISQGSWNNIVPSHSGANDSIMPPTDTGLKQDYDVITPSDISTNM